MWAAAAAVQVGLDRVRSGAQQLHHHHTHHVHVAHRGPRSVPLRRMHALTARPSLVGSSRG